MYYLQRAASPRPIPQAAVDAAKAAGCSDVQTPAASAPGGLHLQPGASYTYDQHPATSGYHDPTPLPIPPRVYTAPIQETNAVHNLEHGAVIMYYRQSGDGALPPAIVARLTTIANESHNVILAPYAPLPDGTALASTAWNKLQTCPATVDGPQADEHRERVHRSVRVHQQRARREARRGLLGRARGAALRTSGTSRRCRT